MWDSSRLSIRMHPSCFDTTMSQEYTDREAAMRAARHWSVVPTWKLCSWNNSSMMGSSWAVVKIAPTQGPDVSTRCKLMPVLTVTRSNCLSYSRSSPAQRTSSYWTLDAGRLTLPKVARATSVRMPPPSTPPSSSENSHSGLIVTDHSLNRLAFRCPLPLPLPLPLALPLPLPLKDCIWLAIAFCSWRDMPGSRSSTAYGLLSRAPFPFPLPFDLPLPNLNFGRKEPLLSTR
mmetsp:Transcript_8115/g.19325  ORF Transcript_8115/g.19325 Transcript_8115/m.19325 type:complete len:232 (+) Transcript_8115:889-1584(+)